MNFSYVKHEFLLMLRSKKNNMFILFLFAFLVSYCFIILPNKQTVDSFDAEQLNVRLVEMEDLQESRESRGATGFINMVGMSPYAADQYTYKVYQAMTYAFEKEEFTRFLRIKYLNMSPYEFTSDETLFPKSPFPVKDREHLYNQTNLRYESYLTGNLPISYEIIEQKTALQTLQNLLLGPLTYLLVFCAIYFSSDVLIRDRRNRSVLQGMPIGWYRLLNLKSLTALLYTGLVLSLLFVFGMVFLTFQNGFGYVNLQMPITIEGEGFGMIDYEMISIGKFILLTLAGMLLLIYLFVRLNFALSLLIKNEWLVLLVSMLILFSERLYFSRMLREIGGIEISYFPQTYFEFGKVISGEKNFLVNLMTISYTKGFLLFAGAILMTELALWITSRIVNRQRFYRTN